MSNEVLKLIAKAKSKIDPNNENPKVGTLDFCLEEFTGRFDVTLVQQMETSVRLGFPTKERFFIREFKLSDLGSDRVTVKPPNFLRKNLRALGEKISNEWPTQNSYSRRRFK